MSASTANMTEYYAGLVDAQLNVSIAKNNATRVSLISNDPRVAEELAAKFRPTRVTIVKRPEKKDLCTALFTGDAAKIVLEFAAEHCVLKKELAKKTLEFMAQNATAEDVKAVPTVETLEDVSLDWASGFFDVRGVVIAPTPATEETKKKRGAVRVILPKAEKFIIPALQKVLNGKVKKTSPCRLVFENKNDIRDLFFTTKDHVRAKKDDLEDMFNVA
jgi:hypothetical protein